MTIRQKAYHLIDDLSDDNVRLMILLMTKISVNQPGYSNGQVSDENTSKADRIRAFEEMEELRQLSKTYHFEDFETEREAAMREKYGDF